MPRNHILWSSAHIKAILMKIIFNSESGPAKTRLAGLVATALLIIHIRLGIMITFVLSDQNTNIYRVHKKQLYISEKHFYRNLGMEKFGKCTFIIVW